MKNKVFLCIIICMAMCATSCEFFDEDVIMSPWSQYWGSPLEYNDNGTTKSLNVAAVSFDIDTSPKVNRDKIVYFIDKLNQNSPMFDLSCFLKQRLDIIRSSNPLEYQKSVAETISGETTDTISKKQLNIRCCF